VLLTPSGLEMRASSLQVQRITRSSRSRPSLHQTAWKHQIQHRCSGRSVLERGGSGLGPSSMPLGEAGAERAWALPTCVGSTSTVQECVHAAGAVMFEIDVVRTAGGCVGNVLVDAWRHSSTGDHSEHSHASATGGRWAHRGCIAGLLCVPCAGDSSQPLRRRVDDDDVTSR
jgi:hypothetical protein